jgi:cytochrome c peroxidase
MSLPRWLLALAVPALLGAGAPGSLEPLPAVVRAQGERMDRFAAIQFDPVPGDVAGNRERLAALAAEAARAGARYVVLPELAFVGPLTERDGQASDPHAEPIPGPTTERFAALARDLGIWIALSLTEQNERPGAYSVTTLLLDDHGEVAGRLRKRVLRPNGEDGPATVGFARLLLDTVDDHGRRLGILSGDDLLSGVPTFAERGADTVLVTANWSPDDPVRWAETAAGLARRYRVNLVIANRRAGLGGILPRDGAAAVRKLGSHVEVAPLAAARGAWEVPASLGLPSVPVPSHQPFTPALVELGRDLFFDVKLSSTGEVACASCHRPELFFCDGRARGEGVHGRKTLRNTPSLLNVAFRTPLQWDGNPTTIEQQFKYPLSGYAELDMRSHEDLLAYVRSRPGYVERLRSELGVPPEELTREHVAIALASFVRTLVSASSPFDRYAYGGEADALPAAARRGLALFTGRAGCAACHTIGEQSALFMDFRFHRLGIGWVAEKEAYADPGVGTVSSNDYVGMFFTPSLRNVAETAPYMHDGSVPTLEQAIRAHFLRPGIDPLLKLVDLNDGDLRDLVAFLGSLTGEERYDARGRKTIAAGSGESTLAGASSRARSRRLIGRGR